MFLSLNHGCVSLAVVCSYNERENRSRGRNGGKLMKAHTFWWLTADSSPYDLHWFYFQAGRCFRALELKCDSTPNRNIGHERHFLLLSLLDHFHFPVYSLQISTPRAFEVIFFNAQQSTGYFDTHFEVNYFITKCGLHFVPKKHGTQLHWLRRAAEHSDKQRCQRS